MKMGQKIITQKEGQKRRRKEEEQKKNRRRTEIENKPICLAASAASVCSICVRSVLKRERLLSISSCSE
jgi:hypothetical protein